MSPIESIMPDRQTGRLPASLVFPCFSRSSGLPHPTKQAAVRDAGSRPA